MPWITLFVAGLLEVGWAVGLKYTDGFTRIGPTIATVICMIASVGMLAVAMRHIPVGTAYAVWTGIGAVGTAILAMILFNEPRDVGRLVCLSLIVTGIVGLKFFSR